MKKEKCKVVKNKKFLWWTWKTTEYYHKYAYRKTDNEFYRKCIDCGRKEIWLERDENGIDIWRLSL